RILERTATPRTALLGGLLVATFFALPITAVHQFEEAVCQVPLLASCWWLLRARDDPRGGTFALLAGTALGVALIVRFPLISFLFLTAAARGGKDLALLGVPTLVFLVAHSAIANRQERFLLPVLPVIILLAALGFGPVAAWLAARSWSRVYGWLWKYYWAVNTVLLVGTLFVYGKKDRVAPLVFVQARHDATGVVVVQYAYLFPVPVY